MKKTLFINFGLVIVSIFFTLIMLEIFYRVQRFGFLRFFFSTENFIVSQAQDFKKTYPVKFNKHLGWVPKPGVYGTDNIWKKTLTISSKGIRSNQTEPPINEAYPSTSILVVGDSFTFGDQVGNNESFPAYIESILDTRVINGGVCAYGIDQVYLRALDLLNIFSVSKLIFAFIPDDIFRNERDIFHRLYKPYFVLEDNTLSLRPVKANAFTPFTISTFRKIAGHSLLAHNIFARSFPEYWLKGNSIGIQRVHRSGKKISVRLINSLYITCKLKNIDFYVLALSQEKGEF